VAPEVLKGALVQEREQHDCKVVEGQPPEERLPLSPQDIPPPEQQQSYGQVRCMDHIVLQRAQGYHRHQHHIRVVPAAQIPSNQKCSMMQGEAN